MSASMAACNCPSTYIGPSLENTCGGGSFIVFMGLLDTFLRAQCDLADPCGRVKSRATPQFTYDFIVVGGGSAGAVVANRLSEIPEWRVLLLEAGGDEPPGAQVPSMMVNYYDTDIDWKYVTEPEEQACLGYPDRRCHWTRGKVLGGCSVLNGMMYLRGSPKDYDKWAAAGNTGWSYNDVLPYFLKSEDNKEADDMDQGYHGQGGYLTVQRFPHQPTLTQPILDAAAELGYPISNDLNGAQFTGFAVTQTKNRNGSRVSSARAFLRPIKDRRNLDIILNATVTKVLIDNVSKRAYGVDFIRNGRKETVRASKEVIVSGGAVNSPQLLLLSGIGPSEDLAKVGVPLIHHLPGVGKNLHNHVAFFVDFYVNETDNFELDWADAVEYLMNRRGPMASTGLSQITAKINTKYADAAGDDPDLQFFFYGNLANCAKSGQIEERIHPESEDLRAHVTIIPVVLHPKSSGYLTLKSKNPLDYPLIYAKYLTDPDDVKTMIEGIKIAIKLSETKPLSERGFQLVNTPAEGCENEKFGSDEYWECAVRHFTGPENHQAGSCKMGLDSDPDAVVSPDLKVKGIQGLRVIDASIMPKVVSANTAATVMMIAEKGCDMIKIAWNKPVEEPGSTILGSRIGADNELFNNDTAQSLNVQNSVPNKPAGAYYGSGVRREGSWHQNHYSHSPAYHNNQGRANYQNPPIGRHEQYWQGYENRKGNNYRGFVNNQEYNRRSYVRDNNGNEGNAGENSWTGYVSKNGQTWWTHKVSLR